jgi:hypothetical protein
MVEEGTLGLERIDNSSGQLSRVDQDSSKDELQHRMEVARESISHTVDEIKDSVVNQYESVKESVSKTLDWHEQVKKRPVAWSAGAAGAGFLVGYAVAAVVKGPTKIQVPSYGNRGSKRAAGYAAGAAQSFAAASPKSEAPEPSGPGLIQRLKETPAYDRVKSEAGVIGNHLVDEISKQAKDILVPAAMAWLGGWLGRVLPAQEEGKSRAHPAGVQRN